MRARWIGTIAAVALGVAAAPASGAESLYAVTASNTLVNFGSDSPGKIVRSVPITGLSQGERIAGIDFRPATGQLFGLGSTSRLYVINPTTGAARAAGEPFSPALSGGSFGFDFNPTVDRIRVVSDADQNLRLNPNDGKLAASDGALKYGTGVDMLANPNVVAAGYTNSVSGATTTQLFGIDSGLDAVVLQNPPNDGTLTRVNSLGIDAPAIVGFDIAANGTAYAAFRRAGEPRSELFRVGLEASSGGSAAPAATGPAIGVDAEVVGLAAAGQVVDDKRRPSLLVDAARGASKSSLRSKGLRVDVSCNESCTLSLVLAAGDQAAGSATGELSAAGVRKRRIALTSAGRRALAARGPVALALTVTATDAAGNEARKRRGVVAR